MHDPFPTGRPSYTILTAMANESNSQQRRLINDCANRAGYARGRCHGGSDNMCMRNALLKDVLGDHNL